MKMTEDVIVEIKSLINESYKLMKDNLKSSGTTDKDSVDLCLSKNRKAYEK